MKLDSRVGATRPAVPRVVAPRPVIVESAFPYEGSAAEQLEFLLQYALLAPSGHNTQPWLFRIVGDTVEIRGDVSRAMPVADPDNRELVMSCGAALLHIRVAVRNFGLTCTTDICPEPTDPWLLARLRLTGTAPAGRTDYKLFKAMPDRRTARVPFEGRPIPRALLYRWQRAAAYEDAWLAIVENRESRRAIAQIIAEGDRALAADERYREEIASWIRPNERAVRDGLPGYSLGLGSLSSSVATRGTFPHGGVQASRDMGLVLECPVFAILGTGGDEPEDWMTAGQALSRVLLAAQSEGVSASFFLQPVEVRHLRHQLMRYVDGETGYPQISFRLGYGPRVPPTPRRPLSEVLTEVQQSGDINQ